MSTLPTFSDAQSVQRALPTIRGEKGSQLVWMYLREHEPLKTHLTQIHQAAPTNSVVILVSGNKDLAAVHQFSNVLVSVCALSVSHVRLCAMPRLTDQAKALQEGDVEQAEKAAAQIRNANAHAKQYPFWIYTKRAEDG